jgi:hypothetical protein
MQNFVPMPRMQMIQNAVVRPPPISAGEQPPFGAYFESF